MARTTNQNVYKLMTVKLSHKQEVAIRSLFQSKGWKLDIKEETVLPSELSATMSHVSEQAEDEDLESVDIDVDDNLSLLSHGSSDDPHGDDPDGESLQLEEGQCPFCLLMPCIATHQQDWMGPRQPPRPGNNLIRKDRYRRYWKTLSRAGAWNLPLYLAKKQASMAGNERVIISREIMPDCVVELVRQHFPNPIGIPYMGHKWW